MTRPETLAVLQEMEQKFTEFTPRSPWSQWPMTINVSGDPQVVVDALRAAQVALQAQTWQPIVSAPKSREFLACMSNREHDFVNWFDGQWFTRNGPLKDNSRCCSFTHWMDLTWPARQETETDG